MPQHGYVDKKQQIQFCFEGLQHIVQKDNQKVHAGNVAVEDHRKIERLESTSVSIQLSIGKEVPTGKQ